MGKQIVKVVVELFVEIDEDVEIGNASSGKIKYTVRDIMKDEDVKTKVLAYQTTYLETHKEEWDNSSECWDSSSPFGKTDEYKETRDWV